MVRTVLIFLLGALLALPVRAEVPVPELIRPVTDLTGTLNYTDRNALEAELTQFTERHGSQVVVLLIDTTAGEDIAAYAHRAASKWRVGRKKLDDGAVIVVALADRAARIEVGRGLEGAIPDILASRIIHEEMIPRFREGDVSGGLRAGARRVMGLITGEQLPAPERRARGTTGGSMGFVPLLFGAMVVGSLLTALFGRRTGALLTSLGVGTVGSLIVPIASALTVAFLVYLMLSAGGSRRFGGRRNYPFGPFGGFGGGWTSGGGFGGGGFSGGGGTFSGGGATGRW